MIILQLRKCVVAIGLALVFGIGSVFGCTCVDMGEPLDDKIHSAYNQASVVFTGKVVALEFQKGISYPGARGIPPQPRPTLRYRDAVRKI